ncbi:MAG: type II pantothenate kinase [Gorillibacterium sp.]|nr:type II pantothenate kinase [Gorillibacterium sp.]
MTQREKVGIDAGGTLIKVAFMQKNKLQLEKFSTYNLAAVATWINETFPEGEICLTGGKSKMLETYLNQTHTLSCIAEFDATCIGAHYLRKEQLSGDGPFILTNVGTGTSVHCVDLESNRRIIGTGVGGGTLLGLSYLLTGEKEYDSIVRKAEQGVRDRIDLKVSHIYEGAEPPIPGDLTASNFGHVLQNPEQYKVADVLASVIGMVGETVTTVSVLAATQCGMSGIVYAGSSFDDNPVLRGVVAQYTKIRECEPQLLENGGYCGAIGALLSIL